jgi:hypothetical protein
MMTKIFLLLLTSLNILSTYAQDTISNYNKKNQIYIGTGYSKHIIQDDVISPFIYKGAKAPIWIKYKYFGNKYIHNISFYYDKLNLESELTNRNNYFSHYSRNINGYFSYSLIRKIYSFNGIKTYLFIGGKFKSYLNYRNHYYTNKDQASVGEQNTSLDLNLSLNKSYNSKNDLITYS